jgi:hypothetical protein
LNSRRILVSLGALAVLTAFYPVFFGLLPVPASSALDIIPGAHPPPERNELGDVPAQFLPWTSAVADAYRAGRLPLRFAANGCGTPLWANPQAQAVTPTTLLALALPVSWASAAAAAVKLFLAASGAFLFFGDLGLSACAAAWAAFAFGFSLHATCWMHFPHTWPIALLPWCLRGLRRVARGEPGGARALFFPVLLLLCGGYPEGELVVAVSGALFFIVLVARARIAPGESVRRFGLASAASLLALGLTAVYSLPVFLAVRRGERAVQADRGALAAPAPRISSRDLLRPPLYWEILRFWIVPEAQGNPRDGDKFGPYSFAGRASGYAGILVLAFAIATAFRRRAPSPVAWARGAFLLLALYALWYPPLSKLLQAAPGIRDVAVRMTTNRAYTVMVLLAALLAAFELDRLRAGGSPRATRRGVLAALAAVGIVAAEYARTPGRPPLTAWRAGSFVLPVVLLLASLVLLAGRTSQARRRVLVVFLLAGTAVDLLRLSARFNPGTRPGDYYPVTPEVRALQKAAAGGRFAADGTLLTGLAYMYGLEDVRVHDPVAPADYEDVLGVTAGYTGPDEYGARIARLNAPILDFLDARARLSDGEALETRATPRAVLPQRVVGAAGEAELLEALGRETDFLRRAHRLGASEEFSGAAEILAYERPRPEELRLRVRSESPRLLVVPETTDGGWTAEGNGASLPTLTANGAFLAVRIPSGETEIVCRYLPPGLRTGAAISGACLGAFLLAISRRGGRSSSRST